MKFSEYKNSEFFRNFAKRYSPKLTEILRNALVRNFAEFEKVVNSPFSYDKFADFHR